MRTGTFLCWLFGHKLLVSQTIPPEEAGFKGNIEGVVYYTRTLPSDYCCRCGINKPAQKGTNEVSDNLR